MAQATSYADITPLEPEWEIPGLVPKSFVTLIMGDGGVGKGQLWSDWVGRVTRGAALPLWPEDEAPEAPGSALLVSSEDNPHMTTVWRLKAARAVLGRVYDYTENFSIPEGLEGLSSEIDRIGDVRWVIIDPLADNLGYVPGTKRQISLTSGNVTLRRYVMRPLEHLAESKGIALVVIHHTVKSGRMAGSKGISDAARMLLRITRPDPSQPLRLITVEKTNIASGTDQVGYMIGGEWPDVRVTYVDPPADTEAPERELSCPDRVLAELQEATEPLSKRELRLKVGESDTNVGVALTRLKQAGLVVSPRRGWWTVPGKVTEEAPLGLVTA